MMFIKCDLIVIDYRPGSDISSSTASETLSTAISDTFEIVDLDDYEAPGEFFF